MRASYRSFLLLVVVAGLAGAVVSGLALSVVVVWPAPRTMTVAVLGAGIGHAMIRDTQVAVAIGIAERELAHLGSNAVLGSLRTLERAGSIAGLIAIAMLASLAGYGVAVAAIAALVLIGAAGFALANARDGFTAPFRRIAGSPPAERD